MSAADDPDAPTPKKHVTAGQAATAAGIAGVSGGVLVSTLSLQGALDRIAVELGVSGLVLLVLLIGAVALVVMLLRYIFRLTGETTETARTQAIATTQTANTAATTAVIIRELRDIVVKVYDRVEDIDTSDAIDRASMAEFKNALLEHRNLISEIKEGLRDALRILEGDPKRTSRQERTHGPK